MPLPTKFNPGVLGEQALIGDFVVRQRELDQLFGALEHPRDDAARHVLIKGPRGSGKTTLARMAAATIKSDPQKSKRWLPIVFAEESYSVTTAGELWLEALKRLQDDLPFLSAEVERLDHEVRDENHLRDAALELLKKAAAPYEKGALLVVENLQTLFEDQIRDSSSLASIRDVLRSETRVSLLGTVTPSFEHDESFFHRWSKYFQVIELKALRADELNILWKHFAAAELTLSQIRPIEILTGGNPRLVRILADFAKNNSFRELMDDLVHLVDEHTEYFKSHLDSLPPAERKVFVALLELWDPATAREIADAARVDVTKASAFLARLTKRGDITLLKEKGKNLYEATERLYNIYYLMRSTAGQKSKRVHFIVRFMIHFYGDNIVDTASRLAREACLLDPRMREDHVAIYQGLVAHSLPHVRAQMVEHTPPEFWIGVPPQIKIRAKDDWPEGTLHDPASHRVLVDANRVLREQGPAAAEPLYREATEKFPENGHARAHLAQILEQLGKLDAAENEFRKAVSISSDDVWAWINLGELLFRKGKREDAIAIYRRLEEQAPRAPWLFEYLASGYHEVGLYREMEHVCKTWIEKTTPEEVANPWAMLAELYHYHLHRPVEAEAAYNKALTLAPDSYETRIDLGKLQKTFLMKEDEAVANFVNAKASIERALQAEEGNAALWVRLGSLLYEDLSQPEQAERSIRKALELAPRFGKAWRELGELLRSESVRYSEAEEALKNAVEHAPNASNWIELGQLYAFNFGDLTKAKDAYQQAIKCDSRYHLAYLSFGNAAYQLGDFSEAREAFEKCIEIEGDASSAWPWIVSLRIAEGADVEEVESISERFLTAVDFDPIFMNWLAWRIFLSDNAEFFPLAERFAREVVLKRPNTPNHVHTLATVLGKEGRWAEAIAIAKPLFEATNRDHVALSWANELAIDAAAAGFGVQLLRLIDEAGAKSALEPLAVGIGLDLGDSPIVAQEILAVGEDVAKKIRATRSEQDSRRA